MTMRAPAMLAITLAVSASPRLAALAVGDQLPHFRGEFLSGRTAVLPQAASGRVALLMLGFTYDSRFQVEAWAKKFRQDFEANRRSLFLRSP